MVIVPKYRKKVLYGRLCGEVGKIIRQLCRQKEEELIEGHAMPDHIHLVLSVPPKYSIAMVLGYLKGKSAIHIHRTVHGIRQGFTGRHFWSRGYCVSTVGLNEEMIHANPSQQLVVDTDGVVLCVAGPGTGKTQVLSTKIARILTDPVDYAIEYMVTLGEPKGEAKTFPVAYWTG
jgi:putative transposase